jgi:arginyl-tRNA synthetase
MFSTLSTAASTTLTRAYGREDKVIWKLPDDLTHGDATTTIALSVAKTLGKPPREIAEALAEDLRALPEVTKAEVAGAGYVNVWLTSVALVDALSDTTSAMTPVPTRKEDPVIVEYSQPNIAKPLGIHHILSTVLGQAVSNMYEFAGYPLLRWNYLGDWGTQFGKLAVAFEKWGTKPVKDCTLDDLLDLYVRFNTEAEADKKLEDEGRAAFRKLEAGDKTLRTFWGDTVTITKAALEETYKRLHVKFDLDLGESFYEDKMEPILAEGKKQGVFVEGEEGSLIVQFPAETTLPPYLVQKGDGATLYSTRDIAQMKYRIDTYHPQEILILTDIAQKLHFQQLIATCTMLGWKLPEFENVLFGRMRFADRSMSTRKGNIVKLEHVLDEAVSRAREVIRTHRESIEIADEDTLAEMMGVGSLVYGVLSQNRKQEMIFDWDKMLSFEGNSAPYLMYTHARAKSILRKAEKQEVQFPAAGKLPEVLTTGEREVIRALLAVPSALEEARVSAMPHILANAIFSLCQAFNHFYHTEVILKAEAKEKELRLALTSLTANVLRTSSSLLTLVLPDQM